VHEHFILHMIALSETMGNTNFISVLLILMWHMYKSPIGKQKDRNFFRLTERSEKMLKFDRKSTVFVFENQLILGFNCQCVKWIRITGVKWDARSRYAVINLMEFRVNKLDH
jgi:hypothetical protein